VFEEDGVLGNIICIVWQVAIDKHILKLLNCQKLSFPMTLLRTPLRKETPDNIEYGEAILVAPEGKAQPQLEVIAPDQDKNLPVLCRLILDIQSVQAKLCREDIGYPFACDEAPDLKKGRYAKDHHD